MTNNIHVTSEIGTLQRLLVHRPNGGIGKIDPGIMEQLLYDDIVFLQKMREEYQQYLEVLMWFLDPEKIKNAPKDKKSKPYFDYFTPFKKGYHGSDKVIDVASLLVKILANDKVKNQLVAAVCATEKCSLANQEKLLSLEPSHMARVLVTGVLAEGEKERFLFPAIPNFIFTRDIGITVKDHILLSRFAEDARSREAILMKYVSFYGLMGEEVGDSLNENVIELEERTSWNIDKKKNKGRGKVVTVEGGDVMMISPDHLLIGFSVRTTAKAIEQVVHQLFERKLVQKVTAIQIPADRSYMHIDTVFTHIKKGLWVMFSPLSKEYRKTALGQVDVAATVKRETGKKGNGVEITQFIRSDNGGNYTIETRLFDYLDDLLKTISREEFGVENPEIVLSAGGEYPYAQREQWTDACNFLTIREGVIIGYDRNVRTAKEFEKKHSFKIIHSADLLKQLESGKPLDEIVSGDTMILLPSSELSRARGGTHCMSMPLLRDAVR